VELEYLIQVPLAIPYPDVYRRVDLYQRESVSHFARRL